MDARIVHVQFSCLNGREMGDVCMQSLVKIVSWVRVHPVQTGGHPLPTEQHCI